MLIRSVDQAIGTRPLPQARPDMTVREACYELDRHNSGALVVLRGRSLAGLLCERDVIRKCICAGRPTGITRVSQVMTPDPVTTTPNATLAEAMQLMIEGGFQHLPVVDAHGVRGLLSMQDIPAEYRILIERHGKRRSDAVATN